METAALTLNETRNLTLEIEDAVAVFVLSVTRIDYDVGPSPAVRVVKTFSYFHIILVSGLEKSFSSYYSSYGMPISVLRNRSLSRLSIPGSFSVPLCFAV